MKAQKRTHESEEKVRSCCRRWTMPREEIFRLMARRRRQPLSAKEIYLLLQPTGRDIGIATIYRTLDLLDKAGVLRKVRCTTGQVRYQYVAADDSARRCNLICTLCGKILAYREFEPEELNLAARTKEMVERKSGFLIRDHNFEYFGLCRKCRRDNGQVRPKIPNPSRTDCKPGEPDAV